MYHTFISSLCCAYHHPQVLGVLRVCRQQDHVDTPARACLPPGAGGPGLARQ